MGVWISVQKSDFNPRSRKGSDNDGVALESKIIISIHAPARGATDSDQGNDISGSYFNPRSRKGSDCSASDPNT